MPLDCSLCSWESVAKLDPAVRYAAAQDSTSPKALAMAIKDDLWKVRYYAAGNPNCPPEALAVAIRDENVDVRMNALSNYNCPPEVLAVAIRDEDRFVRNLAVIHPNFDVDKIREILLK